MLDGARVVLPLDLQSRGLASACEANRSSARGIVADLTDRPDRVVEREVAEGHARLDHLEHECRRSDLEQGGHLRHVGVADDHVQATVLLGVGVRFVARVDDRTRACRRRRHTFPNVLGALGEAERRGLRRGEHLSRAADQLTSDQERQQDIGDTGELAGTDDEVVLVASVRVARRIGVVLEQIDIATDALVGEPLFCVDEQILEDQLPRPVVVDQLDEAVALGGRVLRVRTHIEVESRAVLEKDIR